MSAVVETMLLLIATGVAYMLGESRGRASQLEDCRRRHQPKPVQLRMIRGRR